MSTFLCPAPPASVEYATGRANAVGGRDPSRGPRKKSGFGGSTEVKSPNDSS